MSARAVFRELLNPLNKLKIVLELPRFSEAREKISRRSIGLPDEYFARQAELLAWHIERGIARQAELLAWQIERGIVSDLGGAEALRSLAGMMRAGPPVSLVEWLFAAAGGRVPSCARRSSGDLPPQTHRPI